MDNLDLEILKNYDLLNKLQILSKIEALEQQGHQLHQLLDLARDFGQKLSMEDIIRNLVQGSFVVLNVPYIAVLFPRTIDCSHYRLRVFSGLRELPDFKKVDLPSNHPFIEALHSINEPSLELKHNQKLVKAIENDPQLRELNVNFVATMRPKQVLNGAIMVGFPSETSIIQQTPAKLLPHIATLAGLAIENARLYQMVSMDKKSLLHTYEYFIDTLTLEFSKAARYGLPLSLIMMDIDDFKSINDTWGHRVGDFVIHHFGKILKAKTRSVDICARYGGEEFTALLPMTNASGAFTVAERIRMSLAARRFRLDDAISFSTSVSLGIVTFVNNNISDVEAMIEYADKALYSSKAAGKNQSTVAKTQ